ncbi:NADH-quinone oxidoreductase subunit D [Helicovermis profundi]|uniref:NADH-quinone oxidoreductase subunit D n=2 Tax=Helicovermis profundi TaxID=3065157 RepID=A0AAU9E5I0_9FIRM|nr:NADH-quinone oxidoreductase subunit D [Clostridia bacterium S502]
MNFNSYSLTKMTKDDKDTTYDLFFGPNHPGMHGNFGYVLDMVGTEINSVKPNAGQLHRGFEKLMEQRGWVQNLTLVPRICVMDPDPNEVAYCMAVEKIMNVEIPERAKYLRTITLEMSRLTSHLISIGGAGASLGLYTPMYWSMADRDRVLDMFEWLTGGRVYHIYNIPGGVRRDAPRGFFKKLNETLDYLESRIPEYDRVLFENPIIHKRLKGLGFVSKEDARKTGLSGPNLRASGNVIDIRKDAPYAAYPYLDFDVITQTGGDAFARAVQIRKEYKQTLDIIRQCIKQIPEGEVHASLGNLGMLKVTPGEAYAKVESSKGEFGYYIVSDGGLKPYRVSVRGPSLPAGFLWAQKHLPKMKIDDVAVWMGTLGICPPDFDK